MGGEFFFPLVDYTIFSILEEGIRVQDDTEN